MKIFYDHLCFWQQYGGVPKYFTELLRRLPADSFVLSVLFSNNYYLKALKPNVIPFLPNMCFKGKASIEQLVNEPFSIMKLIKEDFDIYHQTHYNPYAFRYLSQNTVSITTMHDMNFCKIPQFYIPDNRLAKYQKISAMRADRIIAVSENTKNDLIDIWNIDPHKITTIHHGIDLLYIKKIVIDGKKDFPFVLYVGDRSAYKNFDAFLAAFCLLKLKNVGVKLICAGNKFSNAEKSLLKKYNLYNEVINISVTDLELYQLYKTALMFVYPSFYEGFGIPLLEAMACGCPMAVSNASCFPEIADNAALYFDPYSVDDMYDKMQLIIDDSLVRERIIQNGLRRVEQFSIERMFEKHMALYISST